MNRRTFLGASAALLAGCAKPAEIDSFGVELEARSSIRRVLCRILSRSSDSTSRFCRAARARRPCGSIGAGSAEFGIVSADELVVARSRGNDVVALFAVFQNCPQGIMAHASRHLVSIGDVLKEGTLAIQRGLPYARILEKKYGFDHVKVVPSPGGDISAFLHDEKFAQQCFVMSEPLQAKHAGVDVKVFPGGRHRLQPLHHGARDQWRAAQERSGSRESHGPGGTHRLDVEYLDDPAFANTKMHDLNPSMDAAAFAEVAEAQKPYIETAELGSMTAERWTTLIGQLAELGDIPQAMQAQDCFRNL